MSIINKQATGLYQKFEVSRTDGTSEPGMRHHGCFYYVLDVDHDEFAPAALEAYAVACEAKYPVLAKDLFNLARAKRAAALPTESGEQAEEERQRCIYL